MLRIEFGEYVRHLAQVDISAVEEMRLLSAVHFSFLSVDRVAKFDATRFTSFRRRIRDVTDSAPSVELGDDVICWLMSQFGSSRESLQRKLVCSLF